MKQTRSWLAAVVLGLVLLTALNSASACPLCAYANESDQPGENLNRRPQAYMYSILFMLGVPTTILGVFSFSFYQMWKNQAAQQQHLATDLPEPATPHSEPVTVAN